MKKANKKLPALLERMARIQRMEKGKVCPMAGRPHFNHQTWQNGRNVVRYVPASQVASLQQAIEGYRLFMKLANQYADQVIQRTRKKNPPVAQNPEKLKNKPPFTTS